MRPLAPRHPWVQAALATALLLAPPVGAAITYLEARDDVGITFRHAGEVSPGAFVDVWPAFPEILGGGACWADFDGDGYDDLFLVNQQFNPENPNTDGWRDSQDPHHHLYLSDGDGTFTEVAAEWGADGRNFGYGCSAADYDDDGRVDLFVSAFADDRFGGNLLYHNNGDRTFTDVAAQAGVDMLGDCGEFACEATSSGWADYDLDGDLDLYVGTYVETTLHDGVRGPQLHTAQVNLLFRNAGDGTFVDVAGEAGVQGNPTDADGAKTLGVAWFDYDLDGDLDLLAANDEQPNDFYENLGNGAFAEKSAESGLDDQRANMGVAVRDYDNDGYPDVFITHYETEDAGFYRNNGDKTFEDRSGEDDLANENDFVGWGTDFVDLDRDMDLDIVAVNGHTGPAPVGYEQPAKVFRQDPPLAGDDLWNAVWVDISNATGDAVTQARVGRGAAFADYDHDGDTDIAIVNNRNATAEFLQGSGGANHWLTVKLLQPGKNRHAIGARATLEAGGVQQVREVQAGSSYLSQNTLDLEFGLGANTQADTLTVQWPGGGSTSVHDVAADQVVRVERATGAVVLDTLAPVTSLRVGGEPTTRVWWPQAIEVALHAEDRGTTEVSGVAATEYSLDEGATWQAYVGVPLSFASEGPHPLAVRSRDAAGNAEMQRRFTIGLDFGAPTVSHALEGTMGEDGWVVGDDVRVTLASQDDVSGLRETRYRVDDGPWLSYTGPVSLTGQGEHTFAYTAEDLAGNAAPVASLVVRLDNTPPEVALARPQAGVVYLGDQELAATGASGAPAIVVGVPPTQGLGGLSFRVRADASDAVSGMSRVAFVVDDVVRNTDFAPPYAWSWDLAGAGPGLHHVQAIAVDGAGNQAVAGVDVLVATPPGLP